jgi:hypothetical protein
MPGEHLCIVLRRKEKGKDGKVFVQWIVVLRERVFDAIDEWHQGHAHMGQERIWTFCAQKYFDVNQALVKIYGKMCFLAVKRIWLVICRRAAGNQFGC